MLLSLFGFKFDLKKIFILKIGSVVYLHDSNTISLKVCLSRLYYLTTQDTPLPSSFVNRANINKKNAFILTDGAVSLKAVSMLNSINMAKINKYLLTRRQRLEKPSLIINF